MAELTDLQRQALVTSGCEVRTDMLTRCLYAVDASIYRVEPAAVAFPRSAVEAATVLRAAADGGVEITPRGAGTGLAGGALGRGLVVDFARHNRRISDYDAESRTVRVGAGVVLDQLNAELAQHGMWFGPDVATSSRATLGGMIANNSSGAHAPVYGTTADHVVALEVVLADGTVAVVGPDDDGLPAIRQRADVIVERYAEAIAERLPEGLMKRWPGYGFDRALRSPGDLTQLVAGSEGTLAGIASAVLGVVPRPETRYLGVVFFGSVMDALRSSVEFAELGAAAIEHLDRAALDQTVGNRAFAAARSLLRLDEEPCEAMLLVEFFDDDSGLAELDRRAPGRRRQLLRDPGEQELVWGLRRAGLSLLTSRAGPAKPWGFIEDVCVRPERLPEYVEGLREILDPLGLEASFYGHAASGELHVRPVLDLHRTEDISKLRRVAEQVADLCRRFSGSLTAEHGVGLARTEFVEAQIGTDLIDAAGQIKRLFDPTGVMNPGKIIDDGRYRIDGDLRLGEGSEIVLPFGQTYAWIGRDDGFVANLEQCNGCGGCLKAAPTMCPTFLATGDEALSTRGRANTIRAALEGRFEGSSGVVSTELSEVLSSCLSCKACVVECPSNVDMAHLKAELVHARHRERSAGLIDRLIANADLLGRLGTLTPGIANALLGWRPFRELMEKGLGVDVGAPLPPFARQRFDRWFRRKVPVGAGSRSRVLLWDDTWVRYHEPSIGRAAVAVLEAAGFEVALVEDRVCCGRPAASRGMLDELRRAAEHNIPLLRDTIEPIVFLEPSCWSVFVDEYLQLGVEGVEGVADRCLLFEEFVAGLFDEGALTAAMFEAGGEVALHTHCHADALADSKTVLDLLERIPDSVPRLLDVGCCGMAGAFGMESGHRELSHKVAEPLVAAIRGLPEDTAVVASGTSCRHQVADLTDARPLHLAEFLASRLRRADEP
ncbi:MAG: FAD-binding protein [Acidobacteria bacterium]|nr:FAD-binding protein [Acidobacteriota bacterium]